MHRVLSQRASPAMVVALLALFVALGGSAYASLNLPKGSVGTKQLKTGAVTGAKLHHNAVTSGKVKDHSLLAKDFKAGQLPQGAQGSQGAQGLPGPATGPAGGDLTGSYPDPTVASIGGHTPVTDATAAGGALTGTFPSPQLSVTGGDGASASECKSGEAITALSLVAAISCSPFGTITGVSAGTGLTGGGSSGNVALSVAGGGIGSAQLADGSVTTAKFATGAQAPDSAQLGSLPASDYGAVLSGRINGLTTAFPGNDYGAASGTSPANAGEVNVSTLSPDHDLVARDLSIQLTVAPGGSSTRQFWLVVDGVNTFICSITASATTCSAAGPLAVPANSTLSINDTVAVGNAAAADARFAFRLTNQ